MESHHIEMSKGDIEQKRAASYTLGLFIKFKLLNKNETVSAKNCNGTGA